MTSSPIDFSDLDPKREEYARLAVERVLQTAINVRASDVHLNQTANGTQVRLRVFGELKEAGLAPNGTATSLASRIKALAGLTTYRSEVPQEGRLVLDDAGSDRRLEARVSTLPTLHGERIAIRLIPLSAEAWRIDDLGLPPKTAEDVHQCLRQASGVLLITGSAGAGKTSTAYAALREILSAEQLRSIVSLEDPIESELEGVAQSQVQPDKDYGWSEGLRALLRQDPEVMLVGEIRDAETAQVVFQAAMTGQLVITTMHARSCADALRRLLDMDVPLPHLTAGLSLALCQKLQPTPGRSGTPSMQLLVEQLPPIFGALKKALLDDADTEAIQACAFELGMQTLKDQATD